ncbi:hypothetical protein SAMN05216338_100987 [Bradyrhizobium sp. Rc2d]|nr:hypothetical protein SAMN05216338_100987 [Bradyrhizobium sp. Rc2d]
MKSAHRLKRTADGQAKIVGYLLTFVFGDALAETIQRRQPRCNLGSLSIGTILLNAALIQLSGSHRPSRRVEPRLVMIGL